MYPVGTQRYQDNVMKFQNTDEFKTFEAPFKSLMEYVSQQIEEPVSFLRMSYIALGLDLAVKPVRRNLFELIKLILL